MFGRARILLTIAACVLATPVTAQAPTPSTTTAFDGGYAGVSRTFEESSNTADPGRTWTHYCPQPSPPAGLTIVNGTAKAGKLEGSVSPRGVLVMRDFWSRFDGQIDSQGTVRGRTTSGCSYLLVWQKVPPPTMPLDGDYVGVSRESSCLANEVPATLIIRNGAVIGGSWQGNVNPQGVVVMGNRLAPRVDGQIDSRGIIRAHGNSTDGGCIVTFVWRKQLG
jgi:hypothetical protein